MLIPEYKMQQTKTISKLENRENKYRSTGCCKTPGQLWKPWTDLFLGVLLLFLCSFDCQIWAIYHFGPLSPWEWFFLFENLILKKGHISGLAKIDSIFVGWILRVANFDFNYLRHFLINFKNSCGYFAANFLNFLKHPQLFQLGWFWRKLWPKIRKNKKLEKMPIWANPEI